MPKIQGKHKTIPLSKLQPNTWNPNQLDDFMMAKLQATIEKKGFVLPLVVRSVPAGYEVIDGAHRLICARNLKMKSLPCIDLGKITDQEAKVWCEVFIHLHGQPDLVKEAELIRSLVNDDGMDLTALAETLPLAENAVESLYKSLDFDWDQFGAAPPTDGVATGEAALLGQPPTTVDLGTGSAAGEAVTQGGNVHAGDYVLLTGLSDEQRATVRRALAAAGQASSEESLVFICQLFLDSRGE